jgi:hypothetical protein
MRVMSLCITPFSLAALFCTLACAVQAQGISSRDVSVWSEFARSESVSSATLPVDDASFAALSHGGPWSASDLQPLKRSGTKMAFEQARAGHWDALLASLKADNPEPDVRDRDGATLLTLASSV